MLPSASTATPIGLAHTNPPPKVLPTLSGVTLRYLLLPVSVTSTLPAESTASLVGALKAGLLPSTAPGVALPAHVDTFHTTSASARGHALHL
jgi:hypothetical protein